MENIEEAFVTLKYIKKYFKQIMPHDVLCEECLTHCERAISKQMPQNAIVTYQEKTGGSIDARCPVCNASVIRGVFYCGRCGQRLNLVIPHPNNS